MRPHCCEENRLAITWDLDINLLLDRLPYQSDRKLHSEVIVVAFNWFSSGYELIFSS